MLICRVTAGGKTLEEIDTVFMKLTPAVSQQANLEAATYGMVEGVKDVSNSTFQEDEFAAKGTHGGKARDGGN